MLGPTAVPTTGHLLDCTTSSTTCTLTDSGVVAANVVNASSPGIGIAHFAGSTQTETSSLIVAADITSATITPAKMEASTFDVQGTTGTITWAIASVLNAQATSTFTTHTGTATLDVTGPVIGGNYVWKLIQDSTGGITATLGTGCTWLVANGGTPSGAHVITLTNAASAIDVLTFTYDGTNCLANMLYNLKP